MREQLLEVVICPSCAGGAWDLDCIESSGDGIVESGELACATCEARYHIRDGILDLLPHPQESVLRERAGWERFLEGASDELDEEWILALPCVDNTVSSSADTILHWRRQASNFFGLLDLLDLSGDERVLELGAGRCWASAHLSSLGCQVTALDVVRARRAGGLETGSVYLTHGTPYFDRVVASMEDIPFRPETFDLVLSVASIHHSSLLGKVVAEAAGCLRPGGRLAMTSEPCVAIHKAKQVRNAETEAGINEHVYHILDYGRAFRESLLLPKYDLPGALVAILEGQVPAPASGRLKSLLLELVRLMWRIPTLHRPLSSQPANLLGLLLLEYGLTVVAQKPTGTEGS